MKKGLAFISNLILLLIEIIGIIQYIVKYNTNIFLNYIYFTNVISFYISIIYLISFFLKDKKIKIFSKYLKLISTTSLAFILIITLLFIAPNDGYINSFFKGTAFSLSFLAPMVATLSFILFEENEFKYLRDACISISLTVLYTILISLRIRRYSDNNIPYYIIEHFYHVNDILITFILVLEVGLVLISLNKFVGFKKHLRFQSTIYYKDEINDDFGGEIKLRPLPEKYKYESNGIFKPIEIVIYWLIAKPFAYIYMKIKFHQKIVNRKVIKNIKGGYFIYLNHTLFAGDAFTPNIIDNRRKAYIVTGPETGSLTPILPLLRSIGALPINSNYNQMKKLMKCIENKCDKSIIALYPEAHIWPYYTNVRPFKDISFKYPVKLKKPIVVVTNTYQKRLFSKTPKIITFVDGPYYIKDELSDKENTKYLRDLTYNKMKERIDNYSNYSYYNYQKMPESDLINEDE